MKQVWINQLRPGDNVNDIFVVRKLEIKEYNGRKFLSLEFGDKTGRIGGVCWEGVDEIIQNISPGNVVSVRGSVGNYKDIPQITVITLQPSGSNQYNPSDYLPSGPHEPEKMIDEIDEIIDSIADSHYKKLLAEIFNDKDFRRKFMYSPAAKLWHHSYIGGLAEHTLNVFYLCRAACSVYDDLDKDLLLTGALLHDIGKADTYSLDNFFDYTDDGRLLGHIVIADKIITDSIAGIDDFPSEKAKLIRHLVLSHQGEYEQATPVLPQTLEANILYINDLMDSRVGGIKKVLAKTRQPGQRWSNYVKLIERYIYFGDKPGEE